MASGAVLPPLPGGRVVPFTTMQAAVSRNMVESLSVPTFRVGYSMTTDKLDALYEKVPFLLILFTALNFTLRCCSIVHVFSDCRIEMVLVG
jgi:hypothetical protein